MAEIVLIALAAFSGSLLLLLVVSRLYNIYKIESMKKELSSSKASILETYKYEGKKRFEKLKIADGVKIKIKKAGWNLSEYLFLTVSAVCGSIFAGLFYLLIDNVISVSFGFAFGAYIPFFVMDFVVSKRRVEFNNALANSISMLVRMMRNGIGFEQALKKSVEANESEVFKKVFEKFMREKEIVGEERAFAGIYEIVDSSELQIFGISVVIGRSSGGKFSNTLEKLEESIHSRIKLQRKVDVATREASFGSYLIIVILAIIFVMMDSSFEGNMSKYFFTTDGGKMQFMLIIGWVGVGLFLNSVLTKIK